MDGFHKAKKFTAKELAQDLNYNLDQCGYPQEEVILDPMDFNLRISRRKTNPKCKHR